MSAARSVTTLAAVAAASVVLGVCHGCSRAGHGAEEEIRRVTPPIAPRGGAQGSDLFVDVTGAAGLDFAHGVADALMDNIVESVGAGAAWLDHDGDGDLDLYLVDQGWRLGVSSTEKGRPARGNRLYRNRGDGTFEDVTDAAGVGDRGYGFAALVADADNDGDQDLYVLNDGANVLYRNRGDGTFDDVTLGAGLGDARCSVGGTWLDANGDGLLDLYVGNYLTFDPAYRLHYAPDVFPGPLAFAAEGDALYLNQGELTFRDATAESGLDVTPARAMGVVATDFDGDGSTDVFVANDASANFLFVNDGHGRFREAALRSWLAYGENGEATAAMAGSIGDVDGDGLPDLHVTDATYGSLFRNRGDGTFQDEVVRSGVAALSGQWVSWGGGFLDFDDDGDDDLFLANGDLHHPTGRPDLLLENQGDGTFDVAGADAGAYFAAELLSRGACFADFDDDGRQDVLVTTIDDRVVLLRNRGRAENHWLTLALTGRRGNRDAFGARVTITAGGRRLAKTHHAPSGYLTSGDPRLHFGLGPAERVDRIEIAWPGGARQELRGVAVDQILRVVEGEEEEPR